MIRQTQLHATPVHDASYAHLHVCMYVCMHACMYVCNVCVCIHTHTYMYIHMCIYIERERAREVAMCTHLYVEAGMNGHADLM